MLAEEAEVQKREFTEFVQMIQKIDQLFKKAKVELSRAEKKLLEMPTLHLQTEVSYRQGLLAGFKKSLDALESERGNLSFPEWENT